MELITVDHALEAGDALLNDRHRGDFNTGRYTFATQTAWDLPKCGETAWDHYVPNT